MLGRLPRVGYLSLLLQTQKAVIWNDFDVSGEIGKKNN